MCKDRDYYRKMQVLPRKFAHVTESAMESGIRISFIFEPQIALV